MKKLLLPILSLTVSAQAVSYTELEAVKVTAKGFNSSLYTNTTDIQTIHINELESMQSSLSDILSSAAGIQVSQNGGPAQNTNIQIDGINLKNTLVLINGQAIGAATLGQASLNKIPVSQIDRIEILKGSGSSLYGSSAMGGVINIITKNSGSQISISSGSFNNTDLSASFHKNLNNKFTSGLTLTHQRSEGINSKIGTYDDYSTGSKVEAEYDKDKDGNDITALSGSLNYRTDNSSISNSIYISQGNLEYDSGIGYDDQSTFENTQINSQLNFDLDSVNVSALFSRQSDSSKNYGVENTRNSADEFVTISHYASLQAKINTNTAEAIVGIDWKGDNIDKSKLDSEYQKQSSENRSIFTQITNNFNDHFTASVGTRVDNHTAFGDKETFNASIATTLDSHKFTIGQESGFKAPSFNDLYFPSSAYGQSNPDLKPEESLQTSARYEFTQDGQEIYIKVFHTELENLIAWSPISEGSFVWAPANISEATIKGWRASIKENWSSSFYSTINLSRTLTNNKKDSKDLALTPEYSIKAKIGYTTSSFMLTADLSHTGSKFGSDRDEKLDSYRIANISANYRINRNSKVGILIKNITDKAYTPNTQYAGIPRSIVFSLSYEL